MTGLSELDPPVDPTPGYHPDPLGGRYPRWWDGESWRNQVGPVAGGDPASPADYANFVERAMLFLGIGVAMAIVQDPLWVRFVAGFAGGFLGYGLGVIAVRIGPHLRELWNR